MLGGVVVCLYFGLIPISLEHRAHATTANAIWRVNMGEYMVFGPVVGSDYYTYYI